VIVPIEDPEDLVLGYAEEYVERVVAGARWQATGP
jgi:hypothetical protein